MRPVAKDINQPGRIKQNLFLEGSSPSLSLTHNISVKFKVIKTDALSILETKAALCHTHSNNCMSET
jgi:hypothetical protein